MNSRPAALAADTPNFSGSYKPLRDRLLLSGGLAAGLLFWAAAADHSHGFYTFLRLYVSGLAALWAFGFHKLDKPVLGLLALCCALLFNPVFPVELDREAWQVIDVVAGCGFAWVALQTYSLVHRRKWVPYAPAALALGALLLVNADLSSLSRAVLASGQSQANPFDEFASDSVLATDITTAADEELDAAIASLNMAQTNEFNDLSSAAANDAATSLEAETPLNMAATEEIGDVDAPLSTEGQDDPFADLDPPSANTPAE